MSGPEDKQESEPSNTGQKKYPFVRSAKLIRHLKARRRSTTSLFNFTASCCRADAAMSSLSGTISTTLRMTALQIFKYLLPLIGEELTTTPCQGLRFILVRDFQRIGRFIQSCN